MGAEQEIKSLFKFSGDDFDVWETERYDSPYYHIAVEGYIGFENLNDLISLYTEFLQEFKKYLLKNHEEPEWRRKTHGWKSIYKTRAIDVCLDHGCYWVFLDGYESNEVWDLYDYMTDVINQLKEFEKRMNRKNWLKVIFR